MAYYLYVPHTSEDRAGTIVGSFDTLNEAEIERGLVGGQIIEAAKPSYRHLHAYIAKGWKKCEACGRPTPPWRLDGAAPQVASEVASASEGGK
jgi:hypothetical protein